MNKNEIDEMAIAMIKALGSLNRAIIAADKAQKAMQEMLEDIHSQQIKDYTPEQKAMYKMLLENKDGV